MPKLSSLPRSQIAASLVASLLLIVPPRPARACQEPPPPDAYFGAVPAGPGQPLNVALSVVYSSQPPCVGPDAADVLVLRALDGSSLATEVAVTVFDVSFGSEPGYVVRPGGDLEPSTNYELHGMNCLGETVVLTSFTTGVAADTMAPSINTAEWSCTRNYYDVGPFSNCVTSFEHLSITTLTTTADDDGSAWTTFEYYLDADAPTPFMVYRPQGVSVVASPSEPVGDFPWSWASLPTPDLISAPGAWAVVAVDAAGNRSERVVLEAPIPCAVGTPDGGVIDGGSDLHDGGLSSSGSSCQVSGARLFAAGSGLPLAWVVYCAVVVAWRRRRVQNTGHP